MIQLLKKLGPQVLENARYADAEFSDIEVEALMDYFMVSTYDDLKAILAAMKRINTARIRCERSGVSSKSSSLPTSGQ